MSHGSSLNVRNSISSELCASVSEETSVDGVRMADGDGGSCFGIKLLSDVKCDVNACDNCDFLDVDDDVDVLECDDVILAEGVSGVLALFVNDGISFNGFGKRQVVVVVIVVVVIVFTTTGSLN